MRTPNDDALRSLYEVTGKVTDINWVLVDRNEYLRLVAENTAQRGHPLTDEQVSQGWLLNCTGNSQASSVGWEQGVRFAERAHGITRGGA